MLKPRLVGLQSTWSESPRRLSIALLTSLWLAHLAFPLQGLKAFRWTLGGASVPIYYPLTVLPVLCLATYAIIRKHAWTRTEMFWWALPLITGLGVALSPQPFSSLRDFLSWFFRGAAVGGALFFLTIGFEEARRVVLAAYWVACASVCMGYWEIWSGYNPIVQWLGMEVGRIPMGTQGNRIPYTTCLAAFVPVGLWGWTHGRHRWLKAAGAAALISLIIVSQCRSAWVVLMLGSSIYLVSTFEEDSLAAKTLALFSILIGLSLLIPHFRHLVMQCLSSFRWNEVDIQHRLASYRTLLALKDDWLFGTGYGRYPEIYLPHYKGPNSALATPDNQYLRWTIETGIIGTGALLTFLATACRSGWHKAGEIPTPRERSFYKALFSGWVAIASSFFFYDGFYWGAPNFTFWTLLGLFLTCLKIPA